METEIIKLHVGLFVVPPQMRNPLLISISSQVDRDLIISLLTYICNTQQEGETFEQPLLPAPYKQPIHGINKANRQTSNRST